MECHSRRNVTQNGMLLKMKPQLKMECHLKWNVTKNGMSQTMDCHSKYNVTKIECH